MSISKPRQLVIEVTPTQRASEAKALGALQIGLLLLLFLLVVVVVVVVVNKHYLLGRCRR